MKKASGRKEPRQQEAKKVPEDWELGVGVGGRDGVLGGGPGRAG